METTTRSSLFFNFFLTLLFVLAWDMQSHILLNWDVSWFLHSSEKLLAGGTYTKDFWEINPPLILYLYLPAVFLTKIFSLSIITALRTYVFLLVTLSLYCCYQLLDKIFTAERDKLTDGLTLVLATVLLIFPVEQFGQSEHLLLIFIMPYLLGIAYQVSGNKLSRHFSLVIGVMAGFGFAIKPYFLLTFVCLECYHMISSRNIFSWLRTEVFTIFAVIAVYLIVVFSLHRDYLFMVIPLARSLYYTGVNEAWQNVVGNIGTLTCYSAILFYVLQANIKTYRILRTVFLLTTLSLLGIYIFQQTSWYSHLYPAYATGVCLLALEFAIFSTQTISKRINYLSIGIIAAFSVWTIVYFDVPVKTILIFEPVKFYSYFALLFTLILLLAFPATRLYKLALIILATIGLGYSFSFLVLQTSWYMNRFPITLIVLLLLFSLAVPGDKTIKGRGFTLALVGSLVFATTFYTMNYLCLFSFSKKQKMGPLISYLHEIANHQHIAFFSSKSTYTYSLIDYAGASPTLRIQFPGWIHALSEKSLQTNTAGNLQLTKIKNFFIDMLAEDLQRNKPAYVFVDMTDSNYAMNFDYLTYFSDNVEFRQQWQSYSYFTTINAPALYTFNVYKRI
jgi:hypothetical protein